MTLLLRKTREQARIEGLHARGWSEDDYAVIDGETRVGRICRQRLQGEWLWLWFLQTDPAPPPNSGVTDTLEEAKGAFEERYRQVDKAADIAAALEAHGLGQRKADVGQGLCPEEVPSRRCTRR